MNKKKEAAAFFDFDGTIIRKDSFIEFLKYYGGTAQYLLCLLMNSPWIILYFLHVYPNYLLKEKFFAFYFKGKNAEEIAEKGKQFSQEQIPALVLKGAAKVLEWHREKGHDIYLLTASAELWLGEWCKTQDIKFIGTQFELVENKFTGKLRGKNCYGAEKLERIKNILPEYEMTYGYGNSSSDDPFLAETQVKYKCTLNEKNVNKRAALVRQLSS